MPKKIPSYKHMFLYRTGLKLEPSDNFVSKFIEIYMSLLRKRRNHENDVDIDENTAKFFINSCVEAIIYCLDFGFDVWLNRTMVFLQKITDWKPRKSKTAKIIENLHMITIKPIFSISKKMKNILNKDNKEYQEYINKKQESFKQIKNYYKEFYGKTEVWWQQ